MHLIYAQNSSSQKHLLCSRLNQRDGEKKKRYEQRNSGMFKITKSFIKFNLLNLNRDWGVF